MGYRFYRQQYLERPYILTWPEGTGRYTKKMLHKALRRVARRELKGLKPRRAWLSWNSACNWKNW